MTASCLTTERERAEFDAMLLRWREDHLKTAPREQLQAIQAAMFQYRPHPYPREIAG